LTNKQGQAMGPKGLATRQRLLNAASKLLRTQSPVDLTAVSIAKAAKTSSAAFYMYFDDIRDILFALGEIAFLDAGEIIDVLDEDWPSDQLEDCATRFVDGFFRVWDKHRAVLRYRNMEADRGDPSFEKLRMNVYLPLIEALAQRLIASFPQEKRPSRGDARTYATLIHAAMERIAQTDPILISRGLGLSRIKAGMVRMILLIFENAGNLPALTKSEGETAEVIA
jgi:AcrR family transcriptional regulator